MIIVCFGLTYAYVWSYMYKKFLVCCYLLKRGKLGGVQEWVRWEGEGVSKLVGESGGSGERELGREAGEWVEREGVSE